VAGLLNGDQIVAIDGKQSQEVSNLDRVNSFRAGDGRKLKLKIQRDGKTNEIELTLVKEL
jgi:C-terminal processing protease CtpA/Prc